MPSDAPLLEVEGLSVDFIIEDTWTPVIEDVSFSVRAGATVGIVGESGSGKTVSSMAILGLINKQGGRIRSGSVRLGGEELVGRSERDLRRIRGRRIGMIFQQPIRSLDPAFSVGNQIAETLRRHKDMSRSEAKARAISLLEQVHIPDAARRASDYPYAFSGGMCQRVMIAMAIACEPELLIADEPTTALDVTVQANILRLLREVQEATGVAVLFISHDLGVIAEICDEVVMMYSGQVVESAPVEQLFVEPRHPYTAGLLGSIPKVGLRRELLTIPGTMSRPGSLPDGCRFAPRCSHAVAGTCTEDPIDLLTVTDRHRARCIRWPDLALPGIDVPGVA